jgi:hypothetical protein
LGFDDKSPKQFNYIVKSPLAELGLCVTRLCHQSVFQSSSNPSSERDADALACSTSLYHRVEQPLPDASLEHFHGKIRTSKKALPIRHGLIVRGRSFYVRWKVPKRFQPTIGKTHFVKSLRTGLLSEAVRKARLFGAEFEHLLRVSEGIRSRILAGLERTKAKGTKLGRPSLAPIDRKYIRQSLEKGLSIRAAAKKHGVSTATIMRVKQAAQTA